MDDGKYMLESRERIVLEALAQAWNLFFDLPEQHEADAREFCMAIHTAQNIVLARPTMRSLGDIRGGSKSLKKQSAS